jgi:hypothetical protein
MARLHSFYISNAQQELNYAGKDLSDDAFNQVMQSCVSFISDSDMFNDNEIEEDDDNDPFENLVPDDMEKDDVNNQLLTDEDDLNLLLGNLIDLNKANGEEIESEEVDHGESEFNIDDILANVSNSK